MLCWLHALPAGLEAIIGKSGIPRADISIYIKEAGHSNRVIASLNAAKTRTPASVVKVFTLYASVLKLGFDYRFPTQFYMAGSLKNGILHGDLLVKGFGDPSLSEKDIPNIVRRIKAKGIGKITGNIVIDRTYFNVGTQNNSGFDKHTYSPYNAMPDAMMFNERVSTICVVPNKNDVHKKVSDGSYIVTNHLQRVNKPCRGRYSWPAVKIDESKALPEVVLKGKISKRCGNRNICKVITKPYKSFYYALKDALSNEGIVVAGTMKLRKIPPHARILFTHYSKSLEKIVSKTAKKSNNLYARHLLLFLGAKLYGAPATLSKGRKAVKQILRSDGVMGSGNFRIDNGCGLSRSAKLNAKLLAKLYDHAYDRYGTRWMKTLSIAGVDGTIKRRFRGTVARNRAWMKTGTLKHVKNIGGYVKSRAGKVYTAVILVNTRYGRWKAAKLQNDMIIWLVKYKGNGIKPAQKAVKPVKKEETVKKLSPTPTRRIKKEVIPQHKAPLSKIPKMYFIQAGSFSNMPGKSYFDDIEKLGMTYMVRHGEQYKVLIGAYATEERAKKALKKVRRYINSGAFLVRDGNKKSDTTDILY